MFKIRKGLFETNSSSTHSLTMCTKEDYGKWEKGEVYFCTDGKFYTKEEVIDELCKDKYYKQDRENLESLSDKDFDEHVKDFDYYTYDNYNDEYLEEFYEEYTTKSGETVVAFGKYGWDG